jgi:hypothetical protein
MRDGFRILNCDAAGTYGHSVSKHIRRNRRLVRTQGLTGVRRWVTSTDSLISSIFMKKLEIARDLDACIPALTLLNSPD